MFCITRKFYNPTVILVKIETYSVVFENGSSPRRCCIDITHDKCKVVTFYSRLICPNGLASHKVPFTSPCKWSSPPTSLTLTCRSQSTHKNYHKSTAFEQRKVSKLCKITVAHVGWSLSSSGGRAFVVLRSFSVDKVDHWCGIGGRWLRSLRTVHLPRQLCLKMLQGMMSGKL